MIEIFFQILNYKTYKDTISVCQEILQFDVGFSYKILIVDNNSPNESFVKLVDFFANNERVEIIKSPINGGFARGNNYGLRYLNKYKPQFVCLINNDIHFEGSTINHLLSLYKSLENPAVISPIQFSPNGNPVLFTGIEIIPSFWDDLRLYSIFHGLPVIKYISNTKLYNVKKSDIIPGAFQFVSYDIISKLGFFDEDTFLFGEERLLAQKVKEAGYFNYIILDCNYIHEHSKTINNETSYWSQRKLILNGRLIYTKKYRKFAYVKILILKMAYIYHKIMMKYIVFPYQKIKVKRNH